VGDCKSAYDIYISQLVLDECQAGDPSAAQERINEVDGLTRLNVTDDARGLARALMAGGAFPQTEPRDCTPEKLAGMTDDANDTN
jgi:hypothetical protein